MNAAYAEEMCKINEEEKAKATPEDLLMLKRYDDLCARLYRHELLMEQLAELYSLQDQLHELEWFRSMTKRTEELIKRYFGS